MLNYETAVDNGRKEGDGAGHFLLRRKDSIKIPIYNDALRCKLHSVRFCGGHMRRECWMQRNELAMGVTSQPTPDPQRKKVFTEPTARTITAGMRTSCMYSVYRIM